MFLQAKDVPGLNNHAIFYPEPDEVTSQYFKTAR